MKPKLIFIYLFIYLLNHLKEEKKSIKYLLKRKEENIDGKIGKRKMEGKKRKR